MMIETTNLVGVQEIAAANRVRSSAVINWMRRFEGFPTPVTQISGTRVWDVREVNAFLKEHHLPGQQRPNAKLTPAKRRQIIKKGLAGKRTLTAIAKEYGVTTSYVSRIVRAARQEAAGPEEQT